MTLLRIIFDIIILLLIYSGYFYYKFINILYKKSLRHRSWSTYWV